MVTLTFVFGVAAPMDAITPWEHSMISSSSGTQEPLTIYKMGKDMFSGMIRVVAQQFDFIDFCPK